MRIKSAKRVSVLRRHNDRKRIGSVSFLFGCLMVQYYSDLFSSISNQITAMENYRMFLNFFIELFKFLSRAEFFEVRRGSSLSDDIA